MTGFWRASVPLETGLDERMPCKIIGLHDNGSAASIHQPTPERKEDPRRVAAADPHPALRHIHPHPLTPPVQHFGHPLLDRIQHPVALFRPARKTQIALHRRSIAKVRQRPRRRRRRRRRRLQRNVNSQHFRKNSFFFQFNSIQFIH